PLLPQAPPSWGTVSPQQTEELLGTWPDRQYEKGLYISYLAGEHCGVAVQALDQQSPPGIAAQLTPEVPNWTAFQYQSVTGFVLVCHHTTPKAVEPPHWSGAETVSA